jgi:subtilisin family serine protease
VRGVSVSEAGVRDGDRDRSRPSALPAGVDLDGEGRWVRAGEILALEADAASLNAARAQGFVVVERIALSTLGVSVVRLAAPRGKPLRVALEDLRSDDPDTAYDFNHIYFNTQSTQPRARGAPTPAAPTLPTGAGLIGLIDSAVAPSHPALRGVSIQQRDFVRPGMQRPDAHGTAVASLIVGEDRPNFVGAAPKARLLAAGVVGADGNGEAAAADAIVRGLDWIVSAGAPVINISLAGPPNALLEDAVKRAVARGAIIVAAVGNDGPAAPPLYPAAYNDVVGVTAVDQNRNIYRRAGRGDHVDVAAPGVGVLAANRQGRYEAVAGTSFAAPYIAGMLAIEHKRLDVGSARAALQSLYARTRDLGERGRDPVYGAGVVAPAQGN